jgi:ribosomal protein L44E
MPENLTQGALMCTNACTHTCTRAHSQDDKNVNWSQERYDEITKNMKGYLKKIGYNPEKVCVCVRAAVCAVCACAQLHVHVWARALSVPLPPCFPSSPDACVYSVERHPLRSNP